MLASLNVNFDKIDRPRWIEEVIDPYTIDFDGGSVRRCIKGSVISGVLSPMPVDVFR